MAGFTTARKRDRERALQERQREKALARKERKAERANAAERGTPGEDPDLAGIVAGPQPVQE